MYTLIFASQFKPDVQSCLNYIRKKLEAPMAADKLKAEVKAAYKALKENPHRRPLVQDKYLASKGIHSIRVKNYLMFYNIDEERKTVTLFSFMSDRRNWQEILGDQV
jgi:toxin ParE1/3/4